jgi:hypothetical protein
VNFLLDDTTQDAALSSVRFDGENVWGALTHASRSSP